MSVRYATVSAMRAAATSGFNTNVANTCYVDALGDFFNFKAGSTTPDVPNIVVSSSDALGKWHRMGIPPQTAAGALLLYDASGNAIAYAPGTAGQVLTANGAGVPPTWQSGSPWKLIQVADCPNQAIGTFLTTTWTALAYRQVKLFLRQYGFAAGGGIDTVNMVGLTGTYKGSLIYTNAGMVPSGLQSAKLYVSLQGLLASFPEGITFDIPAAPKLKSARGGCLVSNLGYAQVQNCDVTNDDATHDVTGLAIVTTGNTCSFSFELYGVPT